MGAITGSSVKQLLHMSFGCRDPGFKCCFEVCGVVAKGEPDEGQLSGREEVWMKLIRLSLPPEEG